MAKRSASSARAERQTPNAKRMKTIARAQREPSARSLREMPAMDLTQASRRNPYAARIAKEGYTVHVSRGRPRKGEETGPTVTKSVRLPPEVWNRLKERALAEGVPLHALLRAALLAWLERAA